MSFICFFECLLGVPQSRKIRAGEQSRTEDKSSFLWTFEIKSPKPDVSRSSAYRILYIWPTDIMISDYLLCIRRTLLITHTIYWAYWVWFSCHCRKSRWLWRMGAAVYVSFMIWIAINDLQKDLGFPTIYAAYSQASVVGIYLAIQCPCILVPLTTLTQHTSEDGEKLRELEERKVKEQAVIEKCTRLCPNCGARIFKVERTCRFMKCK